MWTSQRPAVGSSDWLDGELGPRMVAKLIFILFLELVKSGLVDLAKVKGKLLSGAIEDEPEAVKNVLSRFVTGQHTEELMSTEPSFCIAIDMIERWVLFETELLLE
jgi:hypothetical protein